MTDAPWFWIIVGFVIAIVVAGLLCLGVFAFANWRVKARR